MDTIIIGWDNENGFGKAVTVCGPDIAPAEQLDLMDKANRLQQFPKGYKCLKAFTITEFDHAIYMGQSVGEQIEASFKAKASAEAKAKAAVQNEAKAKAPLIAAQAKVQETSKARNELMGELEAAKNKLRNLNVTPQELRGADYGSVVESIAALITGDPKKKVAGLEQRTNDAIAAADAAAKELADLKGPTQTETKQPKSQLQS